MMQTHMETIVQQKKLSLADMSSAFVVLGLGISMAVLVFLMEIMYKRMKDCYLTAEPVITTKKNAKLQTN